MIQGRVTVTFDDKELTPKIVFEGDIDMMKMVALPYNISTEYSLYLNRLGDELRKKVHAKGIETKEEPKANTKEG